MIPKTVVDHGSQWSHLADLVPGFSRDVPLFKSIQDDAGVVDFDPNFCLQSRELASSSEQTKKKYQVKLNLWFAPAKTDCGIHNTHAFLETHTQVFGIGKMQKFHENNWGSIYQDVVLGPGQSHQPFATLDKEGHFLYPWHQYYAETDCIWLAVEYHEDQDSA